MQVILIFPIMSMQNAPKGSSESSEILGKKNEKTTISSLRSSAIEREFGVPINPGKFDTYKKARSVVHQNIRMHMEDLRKEDIDTWGDITDDEIASYTKEAELQEIITRMGVGLILMRKKLADQVLEKYREVKDEDPNWQKRVADESAAFDENTLKEISTKASLLRKFVKRIFPKITDRNPYERYDFETLFYDRDLYLDDEGKKQVLEIQRNYTRYRQIPNWEDIYMILGAYKKASKDRQKAILTGLGVTLSIKEASELGLIDEGFLEKFVEENLEELYGTLDPSSRTALIRSLKSNESTVISAEDFSLDGLEGVFNTERKRRKLAEESARKISLELPDTDTTREDIIGQMRRRKEQTREKINAGLEQNAFEEESDMYEDFVEEIIAMSRQGGASNTIKNLPNLKTPNAVIAFQDPSSEEIQYLQIKKVRDAQGKPLELEGKDSDGVKPYGIEVVGFPVVGGMITQSGEYGFTYEEIKDFLFSKKNITILKEEEWEKDIKVTDPEKAGIGGKVFDARPVIDEEPITNMNIATKLDLIDSEGRTFGFGPGTAFIAPAKEEGGKSSAEEVWMVKKVYGEYVDLIDANGNGKFTTGYPLASLYAVLKDTPTFKRILKIPEDSDMLRELQEFGLDSQATLKDGNLVIEDDDHGKKTEKKITCFTSEKGGHIRVESIQNGLVVFGDYDDSGNESSTVKAYAKKHGLDSKLKGLYRWRRLSYGAFLQYLDTQKLTASSKDAIIPDAAHDLHDDHHGPHAHTKTSLLKKLMKWQNPASIMKGMEMLWHGIEHTLEKGAKLDAARFAMSASTFLHLPDSVDAQIYADITNASKEIVEKYEQKIFGLPGPAGRDKCIHIVHNLDSRPEEVMSAINYMIKSYGHLYSEDNKHYQPIVNKKNIETADKGYFAYLDAFIITSKLGDYKYWRMKAYEKAIKEMGDEETHENEPTEEQLLHAIFKTIDGKWKEFPYAASVVKAMGGPSGFEKNWKFEGYDNAFKKGKDQAQMVNAQGRLNKAVGYFNTHEIYKAAGAMESMCYKTKEPKYLAMPFIWAVGGYSKYASHAALQKLKAYSENGISFHAYSFLRNEEANNLYRDTVRKALDHMDKRDGSNIRGDFEKILKRFEFDPDKPKATDDAALDMMKFWQKHYNNGLHDMLQGHNGWLLKQREEDPKVKEYLNSIYKPGQGHGMQLRDNAIPGGTDYGPDYFKEHGYMNMILAEGRDGLISLNSMLNKIKFGGTISGGRPMNVEDKEKIWNYVKKYMNEGLKDVSYFDGDEALQKKQYLQCRADILKYFSEQLTARQMIAKEPNAKEIIDSNIRNFEYYQDMIDMGIDPYAVFDERIEASSEEGDYQRWKTGNTGRRTASVVIPNIEDMVRGRSQDALSIKKDDDQIRAKAGPTMRRSDWKPENAKRYKEAAFKDADTDVADGAAADASDES